jgi:hypothetical protein
VRICDALAQVIPSKNGPLAHLLFAKSAEFCVFGREMPHVDTNLPAEPLRWSIKRAGKEFSVSEETLIKRFALYKEKPDPVTHTYSTIQLVLALYGDLQGERLRELKARADNWELRNGALKGELLERTEITRSGEAFFISVKAFVESSSMTRDEKNDFLESLSTWPIMVTEAARRQTRQLRLRPEKEPANGEEAADEANFSGSTILSPP